MNIFVNMITNIFAFTPNSILLLARFETVYQLLRIYRACTALAENIIYIYIYIYIILYIFFIFLEFLLPVLFPIGNTNMIHKLF